VRSATFVEDYVPSVLHPLRREGVRIDADGRASPGQRFTVGEWDALF
jgi:hypothetical protein